MNGTRITKAGPARALAVGAVALLTVVALAAAGSSAQAATHHSSQGATTCASHVGGPVRVGRFGGLAQPLGTQHGCQVHRTSDAAVGTPPLIWNGGPVMGTPQTGSIVVTPIFWNPSGHPIDSTYKNIITAYLNGVAADSGQHTNVYSTMDEYYGSNGTISYQVALGSPVNDTAALPKSGCTVAKNDTSKIYADGSGYNACLDDNQIIAETDRVVTSRGLPRDLGHIYVTFLPKHVESCFYGGLTTSGTNYCTINHHRSAAYCAYHSQASSGTVYANMPFPVYQSPVGYTCGSDAVYPTVQTPNGNADADTEVSPTSHEIMEAITDPDTTTGWYDSSGYENGDECAYVYGTAQGTDGQLYNQVIAGGHYLTQEEFSNLDFAGTGGGCLQSE